MSDLLNQASLVMVPSGYKEDTVYSVVPSDGSGDLSFTRASNGTRVNSAGLVEVTPWNLVQQSEAFNSASWNTVRATITPNAGTSPNGTATADLFTDGTFISNNCFSDQAVLTSGIYNMSGFVKAGTSPFIALILYDDQDNGVLFNTSTQTITTFGTVTNEKVESVGNGWYRLSFARTVSQGTSYAGISVRPTNSIGPYNGTASLSAYFWGCQLNIGSTAKPYFPTTDRLNVPRLTYQNGGGGCPSLLLEKQSTNIVTYSEQFDDAAWSKASSAVTTNNTTSPDGTQNADLITFTSTVYASLYQAVTTTNGAIYTASIYAKKGNQNFLGLEIRGASSATDTVFNLNTGVVVSGTGTIENVGNGWYRCSITKAANSTSTLLIIGRGDSGANNDTVYLWGAQLEQSSYQTSYIVSTSSSATRVADACSKTGISSLIGQTSGVLFVDFYAKGSYDSNNLLMLISSGSGGEIIYLNLVSGTIEAYIATSSAVQFLYAGGTALATNTRHKLAIAYANNDIALYHNGTQLATDTSASIPACSLIRIGDFLGGLYQFGNTINEAVLFKTRLTNAELASLTTI